MINKKLKNTGTIVVTQFQYVTFLVRNMCHITLQKTKLKVSKTGKLKYFSFKFWEKSSRKFKSISIYQDFTTGFKICAHFPNFYSKIVPIQVSRSLMNGIHSPLLYNTDTLQMIITEQALAGCQILTCCSLMHCDFRSVGHSFQATNALLSV